jgi:CRISPR-associated protein Csb2
MLILEVAYLRGVAVAAQPADRAAAEWPPHPDRLFSALVATWAEHGAPDAGRDALAWLETLGPPHLYASEAGDRDVGDHYVPPNDMTVSGKPGSGLPKDADASLAVLPALRTNRQPRQFPAAIPHDPRVRFVWPEADPGDPRAAALHALAGDLVHLGHSSSLVRAAVLPPATDPADAGALPSWTPVRAPGGGQTWTLRVPYPGRLAELEHHYPEERPPPGPPQAYSRSDTAEDTEAPASVFGESWVVLADAGGDTPDLCAIPAVAARLREAILAHADEPVPEILSGHTPDGAPSAQPHLAIVPMADVDRRYAYGRLMGLGLVLPRGRDGRGDGGRRALMTALARVRDDAGEIPLKLGPLGVWKLAHEPVPTRQALDPGRYAGTARVWRTVTPLVLDRHPKGKPGQREGDLIAAACENTGLPAPLAVEIHKHAPVTGGPSRDAVRVPEGSKLADRPRRHAVLYFPERVTGPVILGAGRFRGLGLCRPVPERDG